MTILLLATLGQFSYASSVATPPVVRQSSMVADPFTPRVVPAAWRVEPEPVKKPAPKPEPTPPAKAETPAPRPLPVAPPKPPAMPAPRVHYRKDVTGKTWYHADLPWLETYVGRINASQVPRYYFPTFQFSSPCAGGSCPR